MTDILWPAGVSSLFITLIAWRVAVQTPRNMPLAVVLLGAFAFRLGVASVLVFTDWVPPLYHFDSVSYQVLALRMAAGEPVAPDSPPVLNMGWLLAGLYWSVGPIPFMGYLFAAIFGTLTVWNVYRIADALHGRTPGLVVGSVWAVLPSVVFVSSQPLRDPVLHLFITTLTWWMVRIEQGTRPWWLYAVGVFTLVHGMYLFRPHQATFVLVAISAVGLISFARRWTTACRLPQFRIMGLVAVVLLVFHPGGVQTVAPYWISLLPEVTSRSRLNFIYPAGKPDAVVAAEQDAMALTRAADAARAAGERLEQEMQNLKLRASAEHRTRDELVRDVNAAMAAIESARRLAPTGTVNELARLQQELEAAARLIATTDDTSAIDNALQRIVVEYQRVHPRRLLDGLYAGEIRKAEARIAKVRAQTAGTSLLLADRRDADTLSTALMLPVRVAIFLLSPFPTQAYTTFLRVALLETWLLYVFLAAGLIWWVRQPSLPVSGTVVLLAVYVGVAAAVYGALEGNLGTAYRHRLQFEWILLIPGAAALSGLVTVRAIRRRGPLQMMHGPARADR